MLIIETTQTMVTTQPNLILQLVKDGFSLKVVEEGKVVYEINPPRLERENKNRVVDCMYLVDEYLIPVNEDEVSNNSVSESVPEGYEELPPIKFGYNLSYRQNQSLES